MKEIVIRPYCSADRAAVREIAWQTAFRGSPGSAFFSDKELLADCLTAYFTAYEPRSCFVAEEKGTGVVGYIIGSLDERKIGAAVMGMAPRMLLRFVSHSLFSLKNMRFLRGLIVSGLRGEFRGEDFHRGYPAVMHINLREGYRDKGIGSRLFAIFLDYATAAGVCGIHLGTYAPQSWPFFEKQGFDLLAKKSRSYFRFITGGDIELRIYGKRLCAGGA